MAAKTDIAAIHCKCKSSKFIDFHHFRPHFSYLEAAPIQFDSFPGAILREGLAGVDGGGVMAPSKGYQK